MKKKVLGIPSPPQWKLKLSIIVLISIVGVPARNLLGFNIPLVWELPLILFSILAFYLYWEIFNGIHRKLNQILPFEKGMAIRIAVQLLIGSLILLITRQTALYLFGDALGFNFNRMHYFFLIIADIFASFTINLGFITHYFVHRWKENALRAERLQKEQAGLKYQQLKNQVNPHLLFNSLSSLDTLIKTNPALASRFVRHMSKVYRYVLQHKENEVVNLETELEFIREYIELQKIRFGNAIHIELDIDNDALDQGIVMVSLQTLIDNAIKHNELHINKPLSIRIWTEGSFIIVSNNKQLKNQVQDSNGQGLPQLIQLYEYLSARELTIQDEDSTFSVRIPLI